ncbi:hypothetical protein [Actinokineospora sp.]|uniref:hypothetical protein n=1 Tax=Actinokineospora sp. TaxID=1872133 RepID=UPI003D6BFEBD
MVTAGQTVRLSDYVRDLVAGGDAMAADNVRVLIAVPEGIAAAIASLRTPA